MGRPRAQVRDRTERDRARLRGRRSHAEIPVSAAADLGLPFSHPPPTASMTTRPTRVYRLL